MYSILGEPLTSKERKVAECTKVTEIYVQTALEHFLADYSDGHCTFETTIKKAVWLAEIEYLNKFQRYSQLGAFIEKIVSIDKPKRSAKSIRSQTPSFQKLCYELVNTCSKAEGLPITKISTNGQETAYEFVEKALRKYRIQCTLSSVTKAYEAYSSALNKK